MFPAALMVMVILGAIVIDVGYTAIRGRELLAVAASAAQRLPSGPRHRGVACHWRCGDQQEHGTHDCRSGDSARSSSRRANSRHRDRRFEIAVTLQLEIQLVMAPALGDLNRVTLIRTERAVVLT